MSRMCAQFDWLLSPDFIFVDRVVFRIEFGVEIYLVLWLIIVVALMSILVFEVKHVLKDVCEFCHYARI